MNKTMKIIYCLLTLIIFVTIGVIGGYTWYTANYVSQLNKAKSTIDELPKENQAEKKNFCNMNEDERFVTCPLLRKIQPTEFGLLVFYRCDDSNGYLELFGATKEGRGQLEEKFKKLLSDGMHIELECEEEDIVVYKLTYSDYKPDSGEHNASKLYI